ncbi:MAG: hypothetical protein ACRCSY_04020 [Cetobacterium sp.]
MTIQEATKVIKIEQVFRFPLEVKQGLVALGLSEQEAIETAAHSYSNAPHWSVAQHIDNYKFSHSL